jgi:hypothetical protein
MTDYRRQPGSPTVGGEGVRSLDLGVAREFYRKKSGKNVSGYFGKISGSIQKKSRSEKPEGSGKFLDKIKWIFENFSEKPENIRKGKIIEIFFEKYPFFSYGSVPVWTRSATGGQISWSGICPVIKPLSRRALRGGLNLIQSQTGNLPRRAPRGALRQGAIATIYKNC